MGGVPDKIIAWQMIEPGKLEKRELPVPELKPGEVLVEVKGCGICHTDLGYFYDGVPTVNKPPLTLGHEIAGVVVAGDEDMIGKEVIIPAVMPCRQCYFCKIGRGNRCLNQKMPGNSLGPYGGFASHIPVPKIDLCVVENRGDFPLPHLSAVADAVTTPFQAAKRGELQAGDNVLVIGVGGVGTYMAQIAKVLNAKTLVVVDIDQRKLDRALEFGADFAINATGKSPKDVSKEFRNFCKSKGLPTYGWKIFECSGTKPGQETALNILSFICRMIVVGFGMHTVEYSISRLMAFDAEMVGTWGCLPEYYPIVLDMVLKGKIKLFVETRPMSTIKESFEEAHKNPPLNRIILEPDF